MALNKIYSRLIKDGEVSEWSKVIDSKSIVRQRTVGSNPTLSARDNAHFNFVLECAFLFRYYFYTDTQKAQPFIIAVP